MEPRVGRRLIAPAAEPMRHPNPPAAVTATRAPTASRFERVPSSWRTRKCPAHRIRCGGRPAARSARRRRRRAGRRDRGRRRPGPRPRWSARKGAPARSETSVSRPPGPAEEELQRHRPGEARPVVEDVSVGRDQVEPAVVVGVEESDPEAEQRAAGHRQADRRGVVGEEAAAQVAVEGRRLAVVVRHGQVEQAVAVEVAAGDPHPRLVLPVRGARHARDSCRPPRSGTRPGCGKVDWPSCRWRRRGRSGRRRRGRRRRRPARARRGRRSRPRPVTSTNRPPSLRKT